MFLELGNWQMEMVRQNAIWNWAKYGNDNRILIFPAAKDAVRGNNHGHEGHEEESCRSHCDGATKEDL